MIEKRRGAAPRDHPGARATVRPIPQSALRAASSLLQREPPSQALRASSPGGKAEASTSRAVLDAQGNPLRNWVGLIDATGFDSLECRGYTSLAHNPQIMAGVDTIARLVGSMTIQLRRKTDRGEERVRDDLSHLVDITPNRYMTRSNFIHWIVRTEYLEGNGNAVVFPVTERGRIAELVPIPAVYCAFIPTEIIGGYRVVIDGREFDPGEVLHFVANPGDYYPWKGQGYRVQLADVANNLKQAAATEKGFMSSKWKPSLIVKVDGLTKEFAGPEGRRKLLESYVENGEAGEPWIIPAQQFSVEQVKPLTLSDLALADFVKLDTETVAAILGVPPFVLGVGEFRREAWNNFINTTIMPIAQNLQQELTRKLVEDPDAFFAFNPRSLLSYDLSELVRAGAEMVDRMAMRRNELRDWAGLDWDEEMEELLALENYIPVDRLGDQKKLVNAIRAMISEAMQTRAVEDAGPYETEQTRAVEDAGPYETEED